MDQIAKSSSTNLRPLPIAFESLGRKAPRQTRQMKDNCPCCGAVLKDDRPLVDLNSNSLVVDKHAIKLRPFEAVILHSLLDRYPRVVSKDALITALYGAGDEPTDSNNVLEVTISNLRAIVRGTSLSIVNTWAVGYRVVLS